MTADIIKFEDAAATYERDKQAHDFALAGVSRRKIAERLGCSVDEVNAAIIRQLGGVPPDFRAREFQIGMERLDEMIQGHYVKARKGDYDSSVICLRAQEMKFRALGLFPPPTTEAALDDVKLKKTSTERLRETVDRFLGKTDRTIDGDVVKREDGDG